MNKKSLILLTLAMVASPFIMQPAHAQYDTDSSSYAEDLVDATQDASEQAQEEFNDDVNCAANALDGMPNEEDCVSDGEILEDDADAELYEDVTSE